MLYYILVVAAGHHVGVKHCAKAAHLTTAQAAPMDTPKGSPTNKSSLCQGACQLCLCAYCFIMLCIVAAFASLCFCRSSLDTTRECSSLCSPGNKHLVWYCTDTLCHASQSHTKHTSAAEETIRSVVLFLVEVCKFAFCHNLHMTVHKLTSRSTSAA